MAFALSAKSSLAVRPVGRSAVRRVVVVRATPQTNLDKKVEEAVKEAEDACNDKGSKSKDCAVAWDTVEELSAAKSHKKATEETDPLENYCKDAPDADECRVYED